MERPRDLLSLLHLDSIRNRILVLALLATLVPTFSTALLSFERTRRTLTGTLEGELRRTGSQAARELDLWEKERVYDLRVFVGSFEVLENLPRIARGGVTATDAVARLTAYLIRIQNRFRDYSELLVTDADGLPVASSLADSEHDNLPSEWLPTLDRGEAMLGDLRLDPDRGVVATLAVPIESAEGRFLGALVGTLALSPVSELLAEFAPGGTGRIELMTEEGRRIAASTDEAVLGPALGVEAFTRLAAAEGEMMEYAAGDGVRMVGLVTSAARPGWSILVHVPADEAYAGVAQLRRTTLILVSALLLMVGGAAYFIGLLIVRPLDRLTRGATAVAGGDLSVDLPVSGGGEVALLTRVFNAMVAELRESRRELDDAHTVLREQYAELEQVSVTDSLTSLFNRRYVLAEFDKEINRAKRHERKLAVLMLDVDRFKQYNDSWGHQAGDEVLKALGEVIRDAIREPDVPGRYGGEEFIVLLPDCDVEGAMATAERVRSRLDQEVFDGGKVTASMGVAVYPDDGDTRIELIGRADEALYRAKQRGRDRVVAAGMEHSGQEWDEAAEAEPAKAPRRKRASKASAGETGAGKGGTRTRAKKGGAKGDS